MNIKNNKLTVLKFGFIFAIAFSMILSPLNVLAEEDETEYEYELYPSDALYEAVDYIEYFHLDTPSQEELIDQAIEGMVENLSDPYSTYFSPSELEELDLFNYEYVGLGFETVVKGQALIIDRIYPDSPAFNNDLVIGDIISEVDGTSVEGLTQEEMKELFEGEEGSAIELTIVRDGKTIKVDLTRELVSYPLVISEVVADGVGYMRLFEFAEGADVPFGEQLDELEETGLETLILDLRDNPGGLIYTLENIASQFMDKKILMFTKDNVKDMDPIVILDGEKVDYEIIILVNENTASASEALSVALQEHDLATVVGQQSYGKGHIQTWVPLSNGGVLSVTSYEYFSPEKNTVDGVGVIPSVEVKEQIPQLITALQMSGVENIEIIKNDFSVLVNDIAFYDDFEFVQKENEVFVPSRILAALVNGEISWNQTERAIEIKTDEQELLLPSTAEYVILQDGITYVNVDYFKEFFAQMDWNLVDGELTISN
ncbi:S41 family peptidase [Chengkuizengella axinellae]|uniref:S41 family peptidase n=1 Tax=Chengkuizengella axinellae TaxID=3064388 RepID=A0ABT9ITQ4_9BACL|nr:S41 family peptidase [Chengkuizengella sp. 2205SS18-9]MDP5272720.1 S41 family peptidase [Chengkuizengella sp. 2205SS18-9]